MTYFLYKRFPSEFKLILALFYHILEFEWLKLHDVADTESLEVLSLVEIA